MNANKCPVCDWDIKEAVKIQLGSKQIVVCCDECSKAVQKDPAKSSGSSK